MERAGGPPHSRRQTSWPARGMRHIDFKRRGGLFDEGGLPTPFLTTNIVASVRHAPCRFEKCKWMRGGQRRAASGKERQSAMRSSHEQRRSVVSGAGGDSGEERAWGERAGEHGRSPRPSGDSMLAMALLWPNYGPTMAQPMTQLSFLMPFLQKSGIHRQV